MNIPPQSGKITLELDYHSMLFELNDDRGDLRSATFGPQAIVRLTGVLKSINGATGKGTTSTVTIQLPMNSDLGEELYNTVTQGKRTPEPKPKKEPAPQKVRRRITTTKTKIVEEYDQ